MGLVVIFLVAALVTRLFDQPLQRGLRRVGGGGR
jgi:peptidoglycan/LPS O-acetylase OafA/YrhL